MAAAPAERPAPHISSRDPEKLFELICQIGSGSYGTVQKVRCFSCFCGWDLGDVKAPVFLVFFFLLMQSHAALSGSLLVDDTFHTFLSRRSERVGCWCCGSVSCATALWSSLKKDFEAQTPLHVCVYVVRSLVNPAQPLCSHLFAQARIIKTGKMAAIKVINIEDGAGDANNPAKWADLPTFLPLPPPPFHKTLQSSSMPLLLLLA
jgi:hypothetical protein